MSGKNELKHYLADTVLKRNIASKKILTDNITGLVLKRKYQSVNTKEMAEYVVRQTGVTFPEANILLSVISEKLKEIEFDVKLKSCEAAKIADKVKPIISNVDIKLTPNESSNIIDKVIDFMFKSLKNKGKLTLTNFGSFRVKDANSRTARNPRTGEKVFVPERKVLRFKVAKKLKDEIE
jgi:nucleoid DNA-binding protein